jgi:hypothetical protein
VGNFATIRAITTNLQTKLKSLGLHVNQAAFDKEEEIPASVYPLGNIFYEGEEFEETFGQRESYAIAKFRIRVSIFTNNAQDAIMEQERWLHAVRDGITIAALNTGDLAASLLVSWVETTEIFIENLGNRSHLNYSLQIRYRES